LSLIGTLKAADPALKFDDHRTKLMVEIAIEQDALMKRMKAVFSNEPGVLTGTEPVKTLSQSSSTASTSALPATSCVPSMFTHVRFNRQNQ
jgi:hypothetical protein